AKERFELAMLLNNLLASPGFSNWLTGESFKFQNFLYTSEGKPKHSIFSIAHLNDKERMFFVTLLLNEAINWMRTQPGTSSLRAILYMDEIFGYFPPIANPPSKTPMMTLLKQARAFGLGIVIATQNPVDLDYKGLSNIGTWFIGRLQTPQDKKRIMDGLQTISSASGKGFDVNEIDEIISNLDNRIFLMNNVHEDFPVIFHTRWVMSFLSGPLTRVQIAELMKNKKQTIETQPQKISSPITSTEFSTQPILPNEITQFFIPIRSVKPKSASKLIYKPFLFGSAKVNISSTKYKVDQILEVKKFFTIEDKIEAVSWENPIEIEIPIEEFLKEKEEPEAEFDELPKVASKIQSYKSWQSDFQNYLYRTVKTKIFLNPQTSEYSNPNETEQDFKIRFAHKVRELRDTEIEKLKNKYRLKLNSLDDKLRKAEQRLEVQTQQATHEKIQTAISLGSTILGAVLGRKTISTSTIGRAGTTLSRGSRVLRESKDVSLVKEDIDSIKNQIAQLEQEMNDEIQIITQKYDLDKIELQEISLNPNKTGIDIKILALAWLPFWTDENKTIQAF
ncbi:MAG: ATP-binding protein, partial [Ignavibacteria bacterium]|nr:ATP-binding protein [Ignavibacteria bacterium]